MKIVLATGLIPRKNNKALIWQKTNQPLGLGYVAAALENSGCEVAICDFVPLNYSIEEAADCILKQSPDIVGFSVMSTCYRGAQQIASSIKGKKNIPIVFGGPHCSSFPVKTMEETPDADFLIYGEGESIFPMLIEAISGRYSYCDIPQLCFRKDAAILINKRETLNYDLDKMPFPAWHLFDKNLYFPDAGACITSRGCSYGRCAFCIRTGLLYEKYRRRSVENVIKELEFLRNEFSFKRIFFQDDNFTQDEEWVARFCEALIQRKLGLRWICGSRVDTVTRRMLERMSQAGCSCIAYGIESGNQKLLNYINKGISLEQVRNAVALSREFGIITRGFFMLAIPGETPEMGRETVKFAIDLDLDFAQFLPARAITGTRLYSLCKEKGTILDSPYDSHDTGAPGPLLVPKINFIPRDYEGKEAVARMIRFAYRKFYIRYRYISRLFWESLKNLRDRSLLMRYLEHFSVFIRLLFYKVE